MSAALFAKMHEQNLRILSLERQVEELARQVNAHLLESLNAERAVSIPRRGRPRKVVGDHGHSGGN